MKIKKALACILFTALGLHLSAQEPQVYPELNENDPQEMRPEGEPVSAADSLYKADTHHVPDSTAFLREYTNREQNPDWWINRIKSGTFNIGDSNIIYPKFAKFCVLVYNWADRFFNTYDPDYVEGTGKKWKITAKFSNWTDSYAMDVHKIPIRMLSNVYSNVGPYLSFMAVSVGYEANLNRLISHLPARQKRWEWNFSTSLFWVNAYYNTNKDGTIIRRFGDFKDAKGHSWIGQHFSDLQLRNYGIDIYYFFNHKRYSQGAAYNFSKYQKRSQGSLLIGLSLSHQYIDMNFSKLPAAMLVVLPKGTPLEYKFSYNDYSVMLGYGYNFVPGKHWLINLTALPNVGIKHCMDESTAGRRDLFSFNVKGNTSAVYNLGSFFLGIFGGIDMHWYDTSRLSFINAVASFGAQTGYRF
ncbi:MAG: DUF4421 domain-containing protein [Prevotella sp.]|nr:DUF4421 domain-containing protein [Prevotella sp.]MCM1075140.1 DUF4421 domain-containing protein [Ruminococcus sp.]